MNIEWYPEEKRVSINANQMRNGDIAYMNDNEHVMESHIILKTPCCYVSLNDPEYVWDNLDTQVIPLEATLTVRKHKDFR